jgi:hypothetical protein
MIDSKLLAAFRWRRQRGRRAVVALALARGDVAEGTARYPSGPKSAARFEAKPREGDSVFLEKPESVGFRLVGFADEILRLNHRGWYSDGFQDETYRGAVFQLPSRKGHVRFVSGYQESCNDGYVIDLSRGGIFKENPGRWFASRDSKDDAKLEAAVSADRFAERAAEREREYQAAWQAGNQFRELAESVVTARRETLAILKERRDVATLDKPALCAVIRSRVDDLLETIREARQTRAKLIGEYEPMRDPRNAWRGNLWSGFADGADLVTS